ncbi:uncharacterized protein [Diadema antillarum]|uniref:uncharacterized protein isoform X1 n=1 Tax=Diadema antillarum TaxID=105358 RepID=UPI003A8B20EE
MACFPASCQELTCRDAPPRVPDFPEFSGPATTIEPITTTGSTQPSELPTGADDMTGSPSPSSETPIIDSTGPLTGPTTGPGTGPGFTPGDPGSSIPPSGSTTSLSTSETMPSMPSQSPTLTSSSMPSQSSTLTSSSPHSQQTLSQTPPTSDPHSPISSSSDMTTPDLLTQATLADNTEVVTELASLSPTTEGVVATTTATSDLATSPGKTTTSCNSSCLQCFVSRLMLV